MRLIREKIQRFFRFALGGTINTIATYGLYLILAFFINYQLSYFIAYCAGIVFSYWFNTTIVFKVSSSWKKFFSYPLIYIVQYGLSAASIEILVTQCNIRHQLAPLIVLLIVVPITYALNKLLLLNYSQQSLSRKAAATQTKKESQQ